MRAEAFAASKVGFLGIVLIGLCSLLLGLMSSFFSLDSVIYFAAMAGVLFPMVMVAAGAFTWWILENPGSILERPRRSQENLAIYSLASGIIAAIGGGFLWTSIAMMPLNPAGKLLSYFGAPSLGLFLELIILFTAYVTLSIIGGVLYDIVMPVEDGFRF